MKFLVSCCLFSISLFQTVNITLFDNAPLKPYCPNGNGFFVLYYGSNENDLSRIIKAQPNFVILAQELNNPAIAKRFHDANIKALMYVEMTYNRYETKEQFNKEIGCTILKPKEYIDGKVNSAIENGFDGIFFDCAKDNLEYDDVKNNNQSLIQELTQAGQNIHDWNKARVQNAKKTPSNLVIMNPGVSEVEERMFDYADIVSVENEWENPVKTKPNNKQFASWRWLVVQGDPAQKAAGGDKEAIKRLNKFQIKNSSFWYYSPPKSSSKSATHDKLFEDKPSDMNFTKFAEYAKSKSVPCSE